MEVLREQSEKEDELSELPPVPKKYGDHYPPQGWVVAKLMESIKKVKELLK